MPQEGRGSQVPRKSYLWRGMPINTWQKGEVVTSFAVAPRMGRVD